MSPLTEPRLFVLDLDGTILSPDHILLDETRVALKQVAESGIQLALATGRRHESIAEFVKEPALQTTHVVADGSYLWDSRDEKAIILGEIPSEDVRSVVTTAAQLKLTIVLNGIGTSVGAGNIEDISYMVSYGDAEPKIYTYESLPIRDSYVQVLLICGRDRKSARESADLLQRIIGKSLTFRSSAPGYISCTAAGVSKGSGLRFLMNKLHLERNEVISIGDGYNDIPMFKQTEISVAMDSSEEAVQQAASMIIPYDDGRGVGNFLTEFVLRT